MRLILPLSVLALWLSACASDPAPIQDHTPDNPLSNGEQPITNPDETLMQADSSFDESVAAFPKHWVEVTVKGKERIYTEYCNMGHPYWKLFEGDSTWQIETFYGQDGEVWNLMNMTANQQSAEGQVFQEGIFVVTKDTYPDGEIYEVSYFWNQTAGFCTFGDFFDKTKKFADQEQYDSFTLQKETCD